MATNYRTVEGEKLDVICWQHYGSLNGTVEAVLEANYGLAEYDHFLPHGLTIVLPDITPPTKEPVRLWD